MSTRDKLGRPVVVVTGMGIVTSLGAGRADNWAKLTSGESGIKTVTRFPIDGLKTTMAGTIDFVNFEPFTSTELSERLAVMATEEALAQAAIGTRGDFPGPLFLAVAPVETEWPQRLEVGRTIAKPDFEISDVLRVSGGGKWANLHHRFMFGSVAGCLADLAGVGVDIVTIGQYLRPTTHHLPVARWVEPTEFVDWKRVGELLGIGHVEASPLTRSSYHARQAADAVVAGDQVALSFA